MAVGSLVLRVRWRAWLRVWSGYFGEVAEFEVPWTFPFSSFCRSDHSGWDPAGGDFVKAVYSGDIDVWQVAPQKLCDSLTS